METEQIVALIGGLFLTAAWKFYDSANQAAQHLMANPTMHVNSLHQTWLVTTLAALIFLGIGTSPYGSLVWKKFRQLIRPKQFDYAGYA